MNIVEHIQHRQILGAAMAIIDSHNRSAKAPYHNNHHMVGVQCITEGLWRLEKEDLGMENIRPEVVLTIAALFHDFDHTAGVEEDSINIYRARAGLRFHQEKLINAGVRPEELDMAEDAIRCTEFPFRIEPRNKLEMVLRDADLLYASCAGDPKIIIEHLRAEIEVRLGHSISQEVMMDGQANFLSSVTMFTKAGQKLWNDKTPYFLVTMEEYVKSLRTQETICS